MKAQMGDVQAKLSAADAEGGRLRNELYSACMQRDEYKETSELQAGELDTLTKLSSTQRAQLDDLVSKKADLEHQVLVAPQAARGGLAHIAENSSSASNLKGVEGSLRGVELIGSDACAAFAPLDGAGRASGVHRELQVANGAEVRDLRGGSGTQGDNVRSQAACSVRSAALQHSARHREKSKCDTVAMISGWLIKKSR
jgi:hypothetical protein